MFTNLRYANPAGGILADYIDPQGTAQRYIDAGPLYALALAGEFGPIAPYVPPEPDVPALKAARAHEVDGRRDAAIHADITVHEAPWQCRPVDLDNLRDALLHRSEAVPPGTVWRDADNADHPVTDWVFLTAIHAAWSLRKSACYAHAWALKAQIAAASTPAGVEAIDIDGGWPQ